MKFISVQETETIIKILTPAYCPITKASSNSHLHSSHFLALYFPSQYQWFFLSLLPFLILEIENNCVQSHYTTRRAPRVVCSTKLSPVLWDSYWDGWPKTNTPCGNNFFFFTPLSKVILKTAELPSLVWCRFFYFSTICCSFRHVRIRVYIYKAISYNRTNKQPDPLFKFLSILLTFGPLKQ